MKISTLRILSLLALLALLGWLVVDHMSPLEKPPEDDAPNNTSRRSRPAVAKISAGNPTEVTSNNKATEDTTPFLTMAMDASIDADERERRIMELGQEGSLHAAHALMELGDKDTYLNFAAINALASIKTPEVEAYLTRKLEHGDPRMITSAAASLATIQGAAAVPSIAATLEKNRLRGDGQQDLVCAACVEAFKQIGDSSALPALAEELDKTIGVSLSYDYGSRIVSVIRAIGDPSGISILQSYTARLSELKSSNSENTKAEHFFQSEIDKATEVITYLEQNRE